MRGNWPQPIPTTNSPEPGKGMKSVQGTWADFGLRTAPGADASRKFLAHNFATRVSPDLQIPSLLLNVLTTTCMEESTNYVRKHCHGTTNLG